MGMQCGPVFFSSVQVAKGPQSTWNAGKPVLSQFGYPAVGEECLQGSDSLLQQLLGNGKTTTAVEGVQSLQPAFVLRDDYVAVT